MLNLFKKLLYLIIGTKQERDMKKLMPIVKQINAYEETISELSNEELAQKTKEFQDRLSKGENEDDILPEAFAVVREASKRTMKMRHFDVQMVGGIALHRNMIAEMKTGEGKTLVATLALYLNALSGKGAHLVTVNDYLAKRDAQWMGPIYRFLGLSVGIINHDKSFLVEWEDKTHYKMKTVECTRREAYRADITYGTNNEFGFDYLRDNMVFNMEQKVQRKHNFAIVDEVDSILIDEARTPLIISGPADNATDMYYKIDKIIPRMTQAEVNEKKEPIEGTGDFALDEKDKSVVLTEMGIEKVEKLLDIKDLYTPKNGFIVHHVIQALKAHKLFHKDVAYVVENGEVVIVDEFTGRKMPGRRWSDGLHQAIEAKERVQIKQEFQTLATITFQNYFRMYTKLAGMTGTAETEAQEFYAIYKLDVAVIPTNLPVKRKDHADKIYINENAKFKAIIKDVEERHKAGQPILIGTVSVEKSEKLSKLLKQHRIPHNVLNAKFHEREAEIVAKAGALGAVTIATNMAGRGTDIKLGGDLDKLFEAILERTDLSEDDKTVISEFKLRLTALSIEQINERLEKLSQDLKKEVEHIIQANDPIKVKDAGGLHIIGSERHEARRIDNQLRGRSGRQGDNGSSQFYVSLQDDLMRIFGMDNQMGLMQSLGFSEEEEIQSGMISKAIENAQKRVENRNFEIRKNLLEYDNVMNEQRVYIYGVRDKLLDIKKNFDIIDTCIHQVVTDYVKNFAKPEKPDMWDRDEMEKWFRYNFNSDVRLDFSHMVYNEALQSVEKPLKNRVWDRFLNIPDEIKAEAFKYVVLNVLDDRWKEHLRNIDHLQEGIGLRGYAQKNPIVEYKLEAFDLFERMRGNFMREALSLLSKIEIHASNEPAKDELYQSTPSKVQTIHSEYGQFDSLNSSSSKPQSQASFSGKPQPIRKTEKIGRNDSCWCGSGKKYKNCHMEEDLAKERQATAR